MPELRIDMPYDLNFIPGIRRCISSIARHFGFNEREAYHIETVVDEICNNAVEHGRSAKALRVLLSCVFRKGNMEMIVKDMGGRKINIKEIFQRNVKLLKEEIARGELINQPHRGRGLIIVQNLVDKLDIRVTASGTTVRILKKASGQEVK